jgi:hypothetical protein
MLDKLYELSDDISIRLKIDDVLYIENDNWYIKLSSYETRRLFEFLKENLKYVDSRN